MADKKITELQLRDNVSSDVNFPSDDGIQSYRVTAAQIKYYILSLESIATSMIHDLAVTTGKINNGAVTDAKTNFTPPTVQRFTSGSGTYTTPAGVKYIKVKMVGGGGGGSGSGSAGNGAGGNGGSTTFGSSLLTAGGGTGAGGIGLQTGGPGGSNTINSPATSIINAKGGGGGSGWLRVSAALDEIAGGLGGCSFFGGSGRAIYGSYAPEDGRTNTGGGGSGAGGGSASGVTIHSGGGGGAGGYIEALIVGPSATYSYSIGTGGTAGTAGTNGYAGSAGGSGVIIVEEYYQ